MNPLNFGIVSVIYPNKHRNQAEVFLTEAGSLYRSFRIAVGFTRVARTAGT